MSFENLLSKINTSSDVYIFGAGKMGQQVAALLRNLPIRKEAKCFVANSGGGISVDGLQVLFPTELELTGDYLIVVASARGNHSDIADKLVGVAASERVVFLSTVELDLLKKTAFTAMLARIGIDPVLLKSMTNDLFSSVTMFDGETYNGSIRQKMYDIALEESARFVIDNMAGARPFSDCWSYREWVLERAQSEGYFLEFGVADGSTLDFFARIRPDTRFFGFDSFVGLPEFWKDGFDQGRFSQPRLPEVPANVELVKGWFSDTIHAFFLKNSFHTNGISFIHVDCDLYSSTRDVLEGCASGLRPGTILAFDEYFNYPGWRAHEHLALVEFSQKKDIGFKYIAYVENGNQVAVEITSMEIA